MASEQLTGAALAKPADRRGIDLFPRQDYELGQFLTAWPGGDQTNGDYDVPLPDIAAFQRLVENGYTPQQVESLVYWIDALTTQQWILRVHGPKAVKDITRGIAKAAVKLDVALKGVTRHAAEACGLLPD